MFFGHNTIIFLRHQSDYLTVGTTMNKRDFWLRHIILTRLDSSGDAKLSRSTLTLTVNVSAMKIQGIYFGITSFVQTYHIFDDCQENWEGQRDGEWDRDRDRERKSHWYFASKANLFRGESIFFLRQYIYLDTLNYAEGNALLMPKRSN